MRALAPRGEREMRVEDLGTPEPGVGEMRARMVAIGVCHTDANCCLNECSTLTQQSRGGCAVPGLDYAVAVSDCGVWQPDSDQQWLRRSIFMLLRTAFAFVALVVYICTAPSSRAVVGTGYWTAPSVMINHSFPPGYQAAGPQTGHHMSPSDTTLDQGRRPREVQ